MHLQVTKLKRSFLAILAGCLVFLSACQREFDTPPGIVDPGWTPTHTLAQLKAMFTTSGSYVQLTDPNMIISGIVVADDKSGNLYKTLYIQDASGGLTLLLDRASLYGDYPVGRRIYIKCNGLYLGDYANMIQLGVLDRTNPASPSMQGIPSALLDNYVVKGSLSNPVTATPVKVSDLGTNMQDKYLGTLIELDGYEFESGDTKLTYADTSLLKTSGERYIKNCTDGSSSRIMVRSSAYSNFAAARPAAGNGKIWAIYTIFRTTKQLVIRDTTDVKFTNTRCNAGVAPPKNLAEMRALTGTTVPEDTKLRAFVISNNLNEPNGNIVIQDATAGIVMRLFNISYPVGTEVEIDLADAVLATFNGTLQVTPAGGSDAERQAKVTAIGPGNPAVRNATVKEVLDNVNPWISTLVKISDVTIVKDGAANATGQNYKVTDATGNLLTFVRTTANIVVPEGKAKSITGYVSQFSGVAQLVIRSAADIEEGGGATDPGPGTGNEAKALIEDFETGSKNGYALGDVELASGAWSLSDAGMFTGSSASASDLKSSGNISVRLRGSNTTEAFVQSKFYVTGLKTVKVNLAGSTFSEGADDGQEISLELKISKDNGATWTSLGKKTGVRGSFTALSFAVNATASEQVMVRFENSSFLRSTGNRLRINIDDVEFVK